MAAKQRSFRIEDDLYAKIDAIAEEEGDSVTNTLKNALKI